MKCNDIAQLLDARELSELSQAEMAELQAHVSGCVACAEQCLASEQMTSFRTDVPPMPASLGERARQLRAICESMTNLQSTRRPVIIGSLLLLGAAATMFAAVPWRDSSSGRETLAHSRFTGRPG